MLIYKAVSFFMSIIMFLLPGITKGENCRNVSGEFAENKYINAGSQLVSNLANECYNMPLHVMKNNTDGLGMPAIWPATSLIESVAEAYRVDSSNKNLRKVYTDLLTNFLCNYKVKNAEIKTPSQTFKNITYYNASAHSSGDYYYDDNAWVCIQLLDGYVQLGKSELLKEAEKNLEFLWTGWDNELGGGIYWDKTYQGKNACSNGPVAIAFLWAYQLTSNETYLERGKMIYDWANEVLRENDLFIDNIEINGNKNTWKAAYNQGTLIYAGSLLFEITGESKYYEMTKSTVNASIPLMFSVTTENISMNANPIFKSWCVAWLARGYVRFYISDPEKNTAAMDCLKAVLDKELEAKDNQGLYDPFFCSGASDETKTEILQQSGVASTFLIAGYYDCTIKK